MKFKFLKTLRAVNLNMEEQGSKKFTLPFSIFHLGFFVLTLVVLTVMALNVHQLKVRKIMKPNVCAVQHYGIYETR